MKISVITISFNSERTIERTIKSVLTQTPSDMEYWIIDGKSKDHTMDIVKKYENDPRLHYISEPDEGISDAFNKGIINVTGDVICIINSDDWLNEGALEMLEKNYTEDTDVYIGNLVIKSKNDHFISKPSMHISNSGKGVICHPSTFISSKAYEKYGMYDKNCRYVMDRDILMRFERKNARFKYIDFEFATFTTEGVTFVNQSSVDYKKEMHYVLKKNGANWLDILMFNIRLNIKTLVKRLLGENIQRKIRKFKK